MYNITLALVSQDIQNLRASVRARVCLHVSVGLMYNSIYSIMVDLAFPQPEPFAEKSFSTWEIFISRELTLP